MIQPGKHVQSARDQIAQIHLIVFRQKPRKFTGNRGAIFRRHPVNGTSLADVLPKLRTARPLTDYRFPGQIEGPILHSNRQDDSFVGVSLAFYRGCLQADSTKYGYHPSQFISNRDFIISLAD